MKAEALMTTERILVVEDEEDIRELVRFNLAKEGFRIRGAESGEDALREIADQHPDLIVLDLMLPGIDGLEVCRRLTGAPETSHIPIIMLTARGEEADIVRGLDMGADDYVTKPFQPKVLLARIKAVLRRRVEGPSPPEAPLQVHDLTIHPGRHEVLVGDGERVDLTTTEFATLRFLAERPGWVFTRKQIVRAVHGDDYPVTPRSVDVMMVSLRRKLGSAGHYVETVRGVGYRFKE